MPVPKIAKGQTKQAQLYETGTRTSEPANWGITGGPTSGAPAGWNVSPTGVVTIPSGTSFPLGDRTAFYVDAGNGTESVIRRYEFEIIEALSECDFDISIGIGAVTYPQKGVASNVPVTATCTRLVEGVNTYVAKALTVVINWGDGSSSTHTVNTSTLGPATIGIPHTYTSRGVKNITLTASVDDCSSTASGSGSVQVVNTRWTCNNGVCSGADSETDVGFATQALCEASGCGFPGAGWYCVVSGGTQTATNIADGAAWVAAGRPSPRYANQIDCPCYSGPVFWCSNGEVRTGTNPPAGVTTYPTEEATIAAGCVTTPGVYTRWRCNSQGYCEQFQTSNKNEGYASCADANCGGPTEPNVYRRYRCENGACVEFLTLNFAEGFASCADANCNPTTEPSPCDYVKNEIADVSTFGFLRFSLRRDNNPGWSCVVTYAFNGIPQFNPVIQTSETSWNWVVDRTQGAHHFIATLTKEGCTPHIVETWAFEGVPPTQPTDPGTGEPCPECPPLPDDAACAPSPSIQLPAGSATVKNYALVRVQTADPNEETDPCHYNYPRSCNPLQSPDLVLFVNEYEVPNLKWKLNSGTPLNGVWETRVDTRDFSNGPKTLKISMRGVGCCRTYATVGVTLANTLQGNILYRDTIARSPEGNVIYSATLGVETYAMEESTSRRYWEQWGVRSGTTLDGAYKHEDWPKHQPVLPILGARWNKQGERIERANYSAQVTFRLPLSRDVRFRRKWTPQFYLAAFDLDCESVTKIRQVKPGQHYIWTQGRERLWLYDGEKVTVLGDFDDNTSLNSFAPNAIDGALWISEANGRKIIVISEANEEQVYGEMFAYDVDSGELAMVYAIRNPGVAPRFVEVVNGNPFALYVSPGVTQCYDLKFGSPKLTWTLPTPTTFCTEDAGVMLFATAHKLYSTNGTAAPTLIKEFEADVTAASTNFVGLTNGEVWKKSASGWVKVLDLDEPVGGVTNWSAGIPGEGQTDTLRGVAAGDGDWLSGERANGSWYDERELVVPIDLTGKTVEQVTALGHYSVDVAAPASGEDAETLPQKDERVLVGTGNSGLLYVYQRSLLSERDGAIPVSHDGTPRLFPFWRRE